jgi:hypothetical protein
MRIVGEGSSRSILTNVPTSRQCCSDVECRTPRLLLLLSRPDMYRQVGRAANPERRSRFQTVIGSLLYLMLGTRPDIAFAVTKLAQHAANPTKEHLTKRCISAAILWDTKLSSDLRWCLRSRTLSMYRLRLGLGLHKQTVPIWLLCQTGWRVSSVDFTSAENHCAVVH